MERQELDEGQLSASDVVEMDIVEDIAETEGAVVTSDGDESQHLRMLEALLFATTEPLELSIMEDRMPEGVHLEALLETLRKDYEKRGIHLICVSGKWCFRTAPDLAFLMERERVEQRRLSRAAIETLSIIAYHQPVTRAEIEEIRGVAVSKGTVDLLLEIGWIRLRGRRKTPGRPVTYGTSESFLSHFGLEAVQDLPGMDELKAAGLLDGRLPQNFAVPAPRPASDEEEQSLLEEDEEAPEFQQDFLDEDGGSEGNGPEEVEDSSAENEPG